MVMKHGDYPNVGTIFDNLQSISFHDAYATANSQIPQEEFIKFAAKLTYGSENSVIETVFEYDRIVERLREVLRYRQGFGMPTITRSVIRRILFHLQEAQRFEKLLQEVDLNKDEFQMFVGVNDVYNELSQVCCGKTRLESDAIELLTLCDLLEKDSEEYKNNIVIPLRDRENEIYEFKRAFLYGSFSEAQEANRSKKIDKKVIKTNIISIVSLLNLKGGKLLIGVEDDTETFGLQKDYYLLNAPREKEQDVFKLKLSQEIKKYIDINAWEFINVKFFQKDGRDICVLSIDPSSFPVFFNGDKSTLIVKNGHGKDNLKGQGMRDYINKRFISKSHANE